MGKRVLVIYHFFYPDDVVSARHLSDLARGLARRGWEVTALTSNRLCRDSAARLEPAEEVWEGVTIHRSWRPAFKQSSNVGRLLNTFWLVLNWLWFIARKPAYDIIVLGTDPQFGYFMLPAIRVLKPRTRLTYWGFDLYPEAIIASGMGVFSKVARAVKPLTRFCYRRLDGMVDIGPCMRHLLDTYGHRAHRATLVPWALSEPATPMDPDPEVRRELFGDARVALLYSGTIGSAHVFEAFIALARELRRRGASAAICFAGRGNRYAELRAMATDEDTNISFAGFADEAALEKRLASADIHLLSLQPGWEGIVVPSKFFGSLAAGRPVLYEGAPGSSIKTWIEQYDLGYFVSLDTIREIADEIGRAEADPSVLEGKKRNAFNCYREHFAQERVVDGWDQFLQEVLARSRGERGGAD